LIGNRLFHHDPNPGEILQRRNLQRDRTVILKAGIFISLTHYLFAVIGNRDEGAAVALLDQPVQVIQVTGGCALDLFTQRFVAPGFMMLAVNLFRGAVAGNHFEELVDHPRLRVEQYRVNRL